MTDTLREQFETQIGACEWLGSHFYATLLRDVYDALGQDASLQALFAPYANAPWTDVVPVRFLGAVHALVLRGDAPVLATHFPSTRGDGDAAACIAPLLELVAAHVPFVADVMTRPPQTNEVGRSVSLAPGFCWIARATARPLALLELGSSAGLNSRWDRYRYEDGDHAFGPPESPLRFAGYWSGEPPFDTPVEIASRRGCDRHPIDATTDSGRITLLSYVWPDQAERIERLRAALAIARDVPMMIDRAPIAEWLPKQLAQRRNDVTTVVFHSIVWQYLDDATRATVRESLATSAQLSGAPLVWLRLEPDDDNYDVRLRATVWPGDGAPSTEHHLADATPHLGSVSWFGRGPR